MFFKCIITFMCPLIQYVPNISIVSCYILDHTFLDGIVGRDTQPCCKTWHTAHSQTPIIMYLYTVYLVLAASIPTSLPTYSRSIEGYRHPHSQVLNPLSPPDTLAYAVPATWAMSREGWLGALDFVYVSYQVIMTYKRILIRHIHTSVISWWWPLYATHDGVWNGPLSSGPEQFLES